MTVATDNLAITIDRERSALEGLAARGAPRIGRQIIQAGIAWARQGLSGLPNWWPAQQALVALLTDAMVAADLQGRLRTSRTTSQAIGRGAENSAGARFAAFPATDLYQEAAAFLAERTKVSDAALDSLVATWGDEAIIVAKNTSLVIEAAAQNAASEIVTNGQHVRQGMLTMKEHLASAGLSAQRPWLIETLVRTQTQLAYGAGRWQMGQDPRIQEILWGWEYKTVGDDRVRPAHMGLDGVKLPKSHERWGTIWPPNGYNCRCTVVEIFKDQQDLANIQPIPDQVTIDGKDVIPGADRNWGFNPGMVNRDVASVLRHEQITSPERFIP